MAGMSTQNLLKNQACKKKLCRSRHESFWKARLDIHAPRGTAGSVNSAWKRKLPYKVKFFLRFYARGIEARAGQWTRVDLEGIII